MEINQQSTVIQKHSSDDRIYSHNVIKSPSDKYHDYIPTGVIDLLPDTEIKIRNESEFPVLENDEEMNRIDGILQMQVIENQYLLFNEDNNEDNLIYTPYTIELLEEEMMILQPNYLFELMLYKNINMIEENELFCNYGFSDSDSDDDDDDNISDYGGEGDLSPESGNEGISSICFSDSSARSTTSSLNSHTQTQLRRKKPIKRSSNGNSNGILLLDKNKLPPTKPQTPTILQLQQTTNNIRTYSSNNSRNSRNSRISNHSRNPSLIYMNNNNSPNSNRRILKKSLNELSTTSVFSLASTDNITHEVDDGYINQSILNSKSLGIHISIQLPDNTKMSNKLDVTQYNENSKKIVEITRDLLLNKKKSINDQLQNISKTNYVKNNNTTTTTTTTTTLNHSIPVIISIENVIDKSIIPPIYYPQFVNFGITGYLGWYYTRHNISLLQSNMSISSLVIKFLPQQTLITGLRIENNTITTISPSHSLKYNTYHIVDCIKDYYSKNILNNNNNNNLNLLLSPLSPLSPLNNIASTPSTTTTSLSPSPSPSNVIQSPNIMNWSVGKCIDEWKKCSDANNFYFNCPKGSDSRNGNFVMSKITLHHSILYEIHKSLMNEIHDYCKENNIIKPKYIILLDHQEYHIPSEFIFLDFVDSEVHVSSNSRWCGVGSGIISCNKFLQSYKIQSYM